MSTTDRRLLADLLKKLGSSSQALSQRRNRLKKKVAMPTDIATYVIAQQQGLRLDQYLDLEMIQTVNSFLAQVEAKEGAGSAQSDTSRRPSSRAGSATAPSQITFAKFKVPLDALSSTHVKEAERMAGSVYPVLYVFENSAREFIDGHLTNDSGKDWLSDSQIASRAIRETVERNRNAEKRNRYHSARNARPIYYMELSHLSTITQSEKGERIFVKSKLFPRKTWFPELVGHFEVSRNVVAHMNPLPKGDVRRLEDRLKEWLDQIGGHQPS
ncbi:MAG: hypothetical protein ACJ76D_01595 [Solirubrobacterales bacterium]